MLKPPWGLNTPHSRHSEQDSGEDLHADVMRFMAIIAFCLLAVFALAQSVPMHAQNQSTTPARTLEMAPRKVQPPVTPKKKDNKQSAHANPIDGMQGSTLTRSARRQSTLSRSMEIARLDTDERLPSVKVERPTSADRLKADQRHPRPLSLSTSSPDWREQATKDSEDPTLVTRHAAHEAKSFVLRFESDLALESLIVQGKVQLFGQVGKRMWRLYIEGGNLRFHPTIPPKQFHAMTSESVPVRIATALRRDATMPHPDRVTWGVTLPRSTTDQVMRYLRESPGGSLVIQSDGQVRLQRSG